MQKIFCTTCSTPTECRFSLSPHPSPLACPPAQRAVPTANAGGGNGANVAEQDETAASPDDRQEPTADGAWESQGAVVSEASGARALRALEALGVPREMSRQEVLDALADRGALPGSGGLTWMRTVLMPQRV